MRQRLWWALMVLAAVFAMHGVQCMAADSTPAGHGMVAAAPAQGAYAHPGADGLATAAPLPLRTDAVAAPVAGLEPGAPVGSHHGAAGHLWEICLAVLAAGSALGLGVLARALGHVVAELARRTQSRLPRAHSARSSIRPPDLAVLCLLRI